MPILSCYVDDAELSTLMQASREMGRTVENLAEAAISEAIIQYRNTLPKRSFENEDTFKSPLGVPQ